MCFSLGASLSAFLAALTATGWTFGVVLDRLANDGGFERADAQVSVLLLSFCLLVALVQLVDAIAHINNRAGHCVVPKEVVAVAGYVLIFCQPLALAVIAAMVAPMGWSIPAALAALVALHVVLCLSLDAPLSAWLYVDVVHITDEPVGICAVVYGFFTPSKGYANNDAFYGSTARYYAYFATLASSALLLALSLIARLNDSDNDYARRNLVAWLAFVGVSFVGLLVAGGLAQVPGHGGSVWCLVSNGATIVACAILQSVLGLDVAALFAAGVVVLWASVFALAQCIS